MKYLLFWAGLICLSCAHRPDPASLRLAGKAELEITRDETLSTPTMVRGTLADISKIDPKKHAATIMLFLKENRELFQLQSPESELQLSRSEDDDLGFRHFRYERVIDQVPIYGDDLMIHINKQGHIYLVNGHYHASLIRKTTPEIPADKAGAIALELGAAHNMQKVEKSTLIFYPVRGDLHLAWHILLRGGMLGWDYFIDAHNGALLFDQDRRRF